LHLYKKTCKIFVLQVLFLGNEENKMKTKKIVIAVLTVTLLLSALLIVGCIDQLNELSSGKPAGDDYQVPEGKGVIRFKISDSNARTIMPTAYPLTDMAFIFSFVDTTPSGPGGDHGKTTARMQYNSEILIPLEPDTYQIVITAYEHGTNGTDGFEIASWASVDDPDSLKHTYKVDTGLSTDVEANLIGKTTGTDKGFFAYDITIGALDTPPITVLDNFVGELVIDTIPVTSPIKTINLNADDKNVGPAVTGDIELNPGYYTVKVTLSADNCQTRVFNNVMHVYPAMTSTYTDILDAPSQNTFTVQFDLNGHSDENVSSPLDDDPTNNQFTTTNATALASPPSNPTCDGFDFKGWFLEEPPATFVTQWLTTSLVFEDKIVYAKWDVKEGVKIVITFNIPDGEFTINNNSYIGTLSGYDTNYNYTALSSSTSTQKLEFVTDLVGAVWKFSDDTTLTSHQTTIAQDTITINYNNNASILTKLTNGTHRINVTGKDGDGIDQSAKIEFLIKN